MLLPQRQEKAVQPSKVLAQILCPNARFVLPEGEIQTPMAAILDAPVTSHRMGKAFDAQRQAADVVASFDSFFTVPYTSRHHHTNRLETFPQVQLGPVGGHRHLD